MPAGGSISWRKQQAFGFAVANLQHQQHVSTRDTPSFDYFRSNRVLKPELRNLLVPTAFNAFTIILAVDLYMI